MRFSSLAFYAVLFTILLSGIGTAPTSQKPQKPRRTPNPLMALVLINIVRHNPREFGKYLLKAHGTNPKLKTAVLSSLKKLRGLKPLPELRLAKMPTVLAQTVPKKWSLLKKNVMLIQDPKKKVDFLQNKPNRKILRHFYGPEGYLQDLLIMHLLRWDSDAVLANNVKKNVGQVFGAKRRGKKLIYRAFALRGFKLRKGEQEPTIFEKASAKIDKKNYGLARKGAMKYYKNFLKVIKNKPKRKLQSDSVVTKEKKVEVKIPKKVVPKTPKVKNPAELALLMKNAKKSAKRMQVAQKKAKKAQKKNAEKLAKAQKKASKIRQKRLKKQMKSEKAAKAKKNSKAKSKIAKAKKVKAKTLKKRAKKLIDAKKAAKLLKEKREKAKKAILKKWAQEKIAKRRALQKAKKIHAQMMKTQRLAHLKIKKRLVDMGTKQKKHAKFQVADAIKNKELAKKIASNKKKNLAKKRENQKLAKKAQMKKQKSDKQKKLKKLALAKKNAVKSKKNKEKLKKKAETKKKILNTQKKAQKKKLDKKHKSDKAKHMAGLKKQHEDQEKMLKKAEQDAKRQEKLRLENKKKKLDAKKKQIAAKKQMKKQMVDLAKKKQAAEKMLKKSMKKAGLKIPKPKIAKIAKKSTKKPTKTKKVKEIIKKVLPESEPESSPDFRLTQQVPIKTLPAKGKKIKRVGSKIVKGIFKKVKNFVAKKSKNLLPEPIIEKKPKGFDPSNLLKSGIHVKKAKSGKSDYLMVYVTQKYSIGELKALQKQLMKKK